MPPLWLTFGSLHLPSMLHADFDSLAERHTLDRSELLRAALERLVASPDLSGSHLYEETQIALDDARYVLQRIGPRGPESESHPRKIDLLDGVNQLSFEVRFLRSAVETLRSDISVALGHRAHRHAAEHSSTVEAVPEYCCKTPTLLWQGDPKSPHVECGHCGFTITVE